MTIQLLLLILFGVLLNASAQILLKQGMLRVGHFAFSWHAMTPIFLKAIASPYILSGLLCYGISVVVWLLVLSRTEISLAYPLVSIGYVITATAAYFLFHEHITPTRLAGIALIMAGVFLITRTA